MWNVWTETNGIFYLMAVVGGIGILAKIISRQWVKVEDRLPKKDERVFVLFKYRGSIMIDTDSYFGENFYNLYGMGKGWNHGGEKIIAWMPIPSFEDILQPK